MLHLREAQNHYKCAFGSTLDTLSVLHLLNYGICKRDLHGSAAVHEETGVAATSIM